MQQIRTAAQARQDRTNQEALDSLDRASGFMEQGWRLHDLAKLAEANSEAAKATDIARTGGASDAVEEQVISFQAEVQQRLDRARKNEQFLSDLLDITLPHETRAYRATESGQMMALAEPSVEAQYAVAFRRARAAPARLDPVSQTG